MYPNAARTEDLIQLLLRAAVLQLPKRLERDAPFHRRESGVMRLEWRGKDSDTRMLDSSRSIIRLFPWSTSLY